MPWSPSQTLCLERGKKVSRFLREAGWGSEYSWDVGELQLWEKVGQVGWSFGGTSWSVGFIPTQTVSGFYGTGDLGGWAVGGASLLAPLKSQ